MAKRFYTVLILPDATSPARKFHITKPIVTAVSSVVAVSVLAFAFFLYQYVNLNVRMLELKQLRQEVGDRDLLASKVGQLEGELSRLRDLDRKLRVVAGLDPEDDRGRLAQGGAEVLSRSALLDAVRKGTGRLAEWVNRDLEALGQEITSRERSFRELKTLLEEKRSILVSTPTIWPVKGLVTAGYGYRQSPFTGRREMHEGLDVAAPHGSPILATADGVVSFSGPLSAFGNVVFINHGHGFTTFYAHNSSNRVKEGQQVRRGEVVAYVGTSGRTTGPHVHYEVQVNGTTVNPLKYIVDPSGAKFANEGESGGQS
ncbi:MAG: peptidoglycan DD-metalloendopeptidase family protein [candidate division NC10 bacterium]|nr:peptidoglycan DD-metalloendopeptidase family protein [candidate division NC10 bacterium]MBI2458163.1 peptidoglycan DD-metalloendopeptidase family protein [candidate division NC10 bacterium]MBI2561390.1 peptidoglycan DD-metalloendopeptidase family protein [candidate division NC10 bacterium]MBI3084631.1 peptidoglycan DD-metalloendopeptidase family protein [candidate division NC10 bacterium]MBI3122216.1 peptidoglycan DD-metalloendopeptidase family protein [candidate division NC10 bacterium]